MRVIDVSCGEDKSRVVETTTVVFVDVFHSAVAVKFQSCVCMCSLSDPSTVGYRKQVDTLTRPANWDAIGPEVRHIYEASLFVWTVYVVFCVLTAIRSLESSH